MKSTLFPVFFACFAAVAVLVAGCGGAAKTKMDTAEFSQAFASAEAGVKGRADAAAKALLAGKLLEGANALVDVAKAGGDKLSEAQKNALINLGATIQLVMSEDGDKADLKVYQSVEDLMAILTERESTKVGTSPDRVLPKEGGAQ